MAFLAKLFPSWGARKKQVDLAVALVEYFQGLLADAILRAGLADEMVEKFQRDGTLTGLDHPDIGLTAHAQLFMFNLISHACQGAELEEDRIAPVIVHVMSETLGATQDDLNNTLLAYLKWFTAIASEINVAETAGDPAPDGLDHRVFRESCAAAERFVQAMASGDLNATDAEAEFFTSLCQPIASAD